MSAAEVKPDAKSSPKTLPWPAPWGRKIMSIQAPGTPFKIDGVSHSSLSVDKRHGAWLGSVREMLELPHGVQVTTEKGVYLVSWGTGVVAKYSEEK